MCLSSYWRYHVSSCGDPIPRYHRVIFNATCAMAIVGVASINLKSEASALHYGVPGWSVRSSTTRRAPARTCSAANEPVIFTSSPIREGCSHLRAGRVIERRESRNERRTLVKPPGNGNAASLRCESLLSFSRTLSAWVLLFFFFSFPPFSFLFTTSGISTANYN